MTLPKIYREFKNLIPPLSDEEFKGLEENILSHGCRDAIKVWRNTIVDGHNRYTICKKHNLPYKTTKIRFSSKKAATLWIVENQLGRRNLPKAMHIKLAMYKMELLQGQARQNRTLSGCKPIHVRKTIAALSNTSERTVQKYMRIIQIGDDETIRKVNAGEEKIGTAYRKLIIKEVENLYSWETDRDINHPCCRSTVLCYIELMHKAYNFALGQDWCLCNEGDIVAKKQLNVHQRVLQDALA